MWNSIQNVQKSAVIVIYSHKLFSVSKIVFEPIEIGSPHPDNQEANGGLASVAWRPAGRLGQAFAVGNAAWMLAAGGLVLAESPARVCASYLEGDQARAGFGLVAWAIAGSVAWLASLRRRPRKGVRARLTAARDRAPLSPRASRP